MQDTTPYAINYGENGDYHWHIENVLALHIGCRNEDQCPIYRGHKDRYLNIMRKQIAMVLL